MGNRESEVIKNLLGEQFCHQPWNGLVEDRYWVEL